MIKFIRHGFEEIIEVVPDLIVDILGFKCFVIKDKECTFVYEYHYCVPLGGRQNKDMNNIQDVVKFIEKAYKHKKNEINEMVRYFKIKTGCIIN